MSITLFASDVATAAGWNPYETPKSIAEKLVHRKFPDRCPSYEPDPVARAATAAADTTPVQELRKYAAALHVPTKPTDTPRDITRAVIAAAAVPLMKGERELTPAPPKLQAAVEHHVRTERGRRDEASVLELYAKLARVEVVPGTGVFHRRAVDADFAVGGKEDGMHADGKTVIEVKNRQRGLFRDMPQRERAQLYVYMFVHGVRRGVWVQAYNGEVAFENVAWDPAFWAKLCERLRSFVGVVRPMLRSVAHADKALATAEDDLGLNK